MGSRQGEQPFDPRQHLRKLANGADYLDVKWRLAWMRSEHPDAKIETELLRDDEDGALFKAMVRLPEGGSAMAHASSPRERSAGHIEQAESKAVGRALAALGYGAEYTDDDLLTMPPNPAPTPLPPTPLRPTRERAVAAEEERPVDAEPERRPEGPRRIEEARPSPRAFEPASQPTPPAPSPKPAAPPAQAAPTPVAAIPTPAADATVSDTEDVSWNKFWIWAKRRGYRDANHLREVLGPDVMQHTPQEVRNMLRKHELDNPPPGIVEE